MNGYIIFYGHKRHEVYAADLWAAKQAGIAFFKPPKSKQHTVSAVLAEKAGKEVTHVAVD